MQDLTSKRLINAALSAARKNNGGNIMNYIKSDSKGLSVSDTAIAKLRTKLGNNIMQSSSLHTR